jgi:hypothetical protein
MALLAPRGSSTPSLLAQGGQRRFPLLNTERDIAGGGRGDWRGRLVLTLAGLDACGLDEEGMIARTGTPYAGAVRLLSQTKRFML